jgi:protein-disulfide isomerase
MKKFAIAAALLAAVPLTAVAAQNWLGTTAATDGGHRMGNPEADTKLMEFVSYTCPHCGRFFKEADGAIKIALVQPGKLSVEIRHFIRDPVDLTAVVLANCGDKAKFFGNHEMFFSRQEQWMAKAQGAGRAQQQRWTSGSVPERLRAISGDLGFYDMMEGRGYSRAQVDRCLNDQAKIDALVEQAQADSASYDVHGTPSFVVNGKLLDGVHQWSDLQKVLASATK